MTRERRATITDVARAAGVATSTVSRAFTRPQRVNAATREHVLAVAADLGYVPNPAARAMGTGRTQTLALLVPDLTNPFFSGVITGAEQAAARGGRTLVVADTQETNLRMELLQAAMTEPMKAALRPTTLPRTRKLRRESEPLAKPSMISACSGPTPVRSSSNFC